MNNVNKSNIAVCGNDAVSKKMLNVGQFNMPKWEKTEKYFRDIFARKYYTNHGPLAQKLEHKLQNFLGVKHAICMTNATIALIIAAKALNLKGKVICPANTFVATVQSLLWAGLEPVFCDINENYLLSIYSIEKKLNKDVSAILGINMWGNICNIKELQQLADKNKIELYFDSARAFGCSYNGKKIGNFGHLEVFSFHQNNILNASEGGCVCTNNDYIAAKLRNIRSSYGANKVVSVPITGNGRMSEAQAAMALLSLEDYFKNKQKNKQCYYLYCQLLINIPGIKILKPNIDESNYQDLIIEVDELKFGITRDKLGDILIEKNIESSRCFYPELHKLYLFNQNLSKNKESLPTTERICKKILQLPCGQGVDFDNIHKICKIISDNVKNG